MPKLCLTSSMGKPVMSHITSMPTGMMDGSPPGRAMTNSSATPDVATLMGFIGLIVPAFKV